MVLFLSFGVSCLLGSHFLFATGICGLFFCLPWARWVSFTSSSAIGICVGLFVFALLALVSGYWCISVFGIVLCTCCSSASSLETLTGIFSKLVTLWTAIQMLLWSKPHLVFHHKVYEISLSEMLTTQMDVTEAQHQSWLVWIVQIWPNFASHQIDFAGTLA